MRKLITLALILAFTATVAVGQEKKPRIADKKFWLVVAVSAATAILDVESTSYCMRHNPGCTESNRWLYGERPSRRRMYFTQAGVVAGISGATYLLKKTLQKEGQLGWFWPVPQLGASAAQVYLASENYKLGNRGKVCPANGAGCQ